MESFRERVKRLRDVLHGDIAVEPAVEPDETDQSVMDEPDFEEENRFSPDEESEVEDNGKPDEDDSVEDESLETIFRPSGAPIEILSMEDADDL